MTSPAPQAPTRRGLAVTAAVLGVSTVSTFAIGWALAATAPGMEGLAIGVMALFAIAVIGAASLIVGIFAVVLARPRWVGILGLALTVATLLLIASLMVPWSAMFAS